MVVENLPRHQADTWQPALLFPAIPGDEHGQIRLRFGIRVQLHDAGKQFFFGFPHNRNSPKHHQPHIKKQDTTPSQRNREVPIHNFHELVNSESEFESESLQEVCLVSHLHSILVL